MTRLDGKQLMFTGGVLKAMVKFDRDSDTPIDGGNGGDAGDYAPILGGFYAHNLTDRLKFGTSIVTISGTILDYDDDWTGRYLNTEVSLFTITFNPTIAYRFTDWLSIGGGPQIMYADLEIKSKAPPPNGTGEVKIDGDDVAYGFNLDALIELSENTRLGIGYQSKIEPEVSGDVKFKDGAVRADAGTDTEITFAQFVRLGIYHELNDQWALLGTVGWEDWSDFEDINISTGEGSQKIPRNWDDTYKFAAGVHFCCNLVFLMIPRLWILKTEHRICLLIGKFVMQPERNINGVRIYHLGGSLYTLIMATARLKMICSEEIISAMTFSFWPSMPIGSFNRLTPSRYDVFGQLHLKIS
jgi:long-chain fatty acid transport protein